MDDDPVLRSLADDLTRDDPRLAALLSGAGARRHRTWSARRLLVAVPIGVLLLIVGLLVPPTVAIGVTAMALAVASPLAVCWLLPRERPD